MIARIEAARAAGPADHRRHVHLYGRRHRARRVDAALGPGRRARGLDRAAARSGDPRPGRRGDARPGAGLGESVPRRRAGRGCCSPISGTRRCAATPARRWPRSRASAAPAPEETAMDLVVEDGSRVGTIYFLMSEDNVRRQVAAALDELRLGRGQRRHRGRVPQRASASAHLRQFRPPARPLCARRAAGAAAGGDPAADLAARGQSRHRATAARCAPAISPISPSSIRRRSPTARPSRRRMLMRSACATSSSTAPRCLPTASRPAPRRAGSCAAPAGGAVAEPISVVTCHGPRWGRSR